MLVARFRVLDIRYLTFYQLPDKVITYVNVFRPPHADWVFYYRDYSLVVFKQVNSLTGKFWLQEIQHSLCEYRGLCSLRHGYVFCLASRQSNTVLRSTTSIHNCAPYHHRHPGH